jgi:hypothetical protein
MNAYSEFTIRLLGVMSQYYVYGLLQCDLL